MFGLINRGELDPNTENELENLVSRLKRLWLTEHNEDGTHNLGVISTNSTSNAVPAGVVLPFAGTIAPTGYLLADGSAVSRTIYADLFAAVSTTYGVGDGSTTFNLPDLRQRFPLGKAAAGTGSSLGSTGGAIDHTHTGPSHTHTIADHTHTMAHTHSVPRDGWGSTVENPATSGRLVTGQGAGTSSVANTDNTTGASSAANTGSQGLVTDAGGTGNTGTANPPYVVLNYIIKT